MRDPLLIVGDWILLLTAVGTIAFVIRYGVFSQWRSNLAGRAVMYTMGSLALLSLVVFASVFFGNYPLRPYVRIGAFSAVLVAVWWLLFTLLRLQRRTKRK